MEITTSFLIYATLFRIAVIVAGVVALVLGYRLFSSVGASSGDTSAEGQVGDIKLSLKNAAPGTCFALFGALIIVAMLVQGSPELVISELKEVTAESGESRYSTNTLLKGGQEAPSAAAKPQFTRLIKAAGLLDKQGDHQAAVAGYSEALAMPEVTLKEASVAFNAIAWIYFEQGNFKEAMPLARLAVRLDSGKPEFLDTLANLLLESGESHAALKRARQAVQLSPAGADFLYTLARAYRANGDSEQALQQMERAAELDERYQQKLIHFQQSLH